MPPLAVVGLTLEGGVGSQASGALLLFLTNVAAIMLTGVGVMWLFRVHVPALRGTGRSINRRRAIKIVVGLVAVIAIPLVAATVTITKDTVDNARVADVARTWSADAGWTIVSVTTEEGATVVVATGPLPTPEPEALRAELNARGLHDVDVTLRLIPEERIELPGD